MVYGGGRWPLASSRDPGLDEHLGARQAGDRAGSRLLPGGRQRARHLPATSSTWPTMPRWATRPFASVFRTTTFTPGSWVCARRWR